MNNRMTFIGRLGILATALLAVSCTDPVSPTPRNPEFTLAPTVMEVTGLGQIGTGSLTPGDSVTTFDFDVRSDLSGRFTATDYAAVHPNGVPASVTVDHSADPATGITAYRNSSTACSDPTRGVEFDAVSREDNGALDPFTLAVCDNGPANSGQDFWSIVVPVDDFRLSGIVTSGDIVKSTGPSSTGSLVASTSTSGASLPKGYTVTVDGVASQSIGINSSVTFTGLTATSHTVTLSGVPTNCTVSGGASRTVTVPAGGSATAAFSVSCTAFSGVEVSGTGQIGSGSPTPGSNLQTFTFDVRSDLSGTLTYTDYSKSASVQVGPAFPGTGITAFRTSSNSCTDPTKGAEFDGVGQVTGATGLLNFTVAVCDNGPAGSGMDFFRFSAPSISYSASGTLTGGDIVKSTTGGPATGQLTVTTTTSGTSLPSGYTVTLDGTTSQSIGINGSVTFTNLTATSHTVTLKGVPGNCTVSGGTSRTVTVPSGGTATVSYSVTCTTPNQPPSVNAGSDQTVLLGLLYTETASFSDPNNDGPWSYTINWGDGSSTSGSTSSQGTISASHSYLLGSFTIRVTVTDSHGASGSDSKVLTVITNLGGLP